MCWKVSWTEQLKLLIKGLVVNSLGLTRTEHQLIIWMADLYKAGLFIPLLKHSLLSHCTEERKSLGYNLCLHKTKAENTRKITFSRCTGNCVDMVFALLVSQYIRSEYTISKTCVVWSSSRIITSSMIPKWPHHLISLGHSLLSCAINTCQKQNLHS